MVRGMGLEIGARPVSYTHLDVYKRQLQVHDELIVEATEKELEEVKIILAEEMTRAASLKVELKVDITHGKSWYETK